MASEETYYFKHDYNARSDPKMKRLLSKHGMQGIGIYWSIIEDLYNNANALPTQYDVIAFDLRCDENVIRSVINDFDLFQVNEDYFGSPSVEKRLLKREEKSLKARRSAAYRWSSIQKEDANAMQTQCDSNAIKERKGKDKKENKEGEKNKDETAKRFQPPTQEEVQSYVQSKGYSVDAEAFIAFYTSKGWMIGNNKMKDWRSAVVTWSKKDRQPNKANYGNRHREVSCAPGGSTGWTDTV